MEPISIALSVVQMLATAFKAAGGLKTMGALVIGLAGLVGYKKDVHKKFHRHKTEQRHHHDKHK